jgi:hypothetical protein
MRERVTFQRTDMNRDLIEDIFRDAHVVDLDFSVWDRFVSMVVVAVEAAASSGRRLPMYVVEFQRVRRVEIDFAHYGIEVEFGHFQWNVYGVEIDGVEGRLGIRLSSSQHLPSSFIACEDVAVRRLDNDLLDKRFPGWNKPGAPFIRPSVEELIKECVRHK